MKKIAILLLLLFLVGCTTGGKKEDSNPTNVEIFNLNDADEVIVGGDKLSLTVFVYPSNADQSVTWSSSNDTVATVDEVGNVTGLQEGQVTIFATSKVDAKVKGSINIFVYDDAKNLKTIDDIKKFLDTVVPSEATEDILIPFVVEGVKLSWNSSDEDTISRTGKVKRDLVDRRVTLSCTINISRVQGEFTKEVMVSKYELRNPDRKLVFTYLYDYNGSFTGFNDGDLDKIDVINYAFAGIRDGKLSVSTSSNLESIVKQAHEKGVRVVLAIGGWGVDGFSDAVLTAQTRKVFIDSILAGIDKYRLNGIDLDWEYPTSTASGLIKARPEDKVNFTYLCQELKAALKAKNPDLTLSIAVPNGSWAAQTYYEVDKLNASIDFLHLMSYDVINFATSTNKIVKASHHTNLFTSSLSVSSADAGVNAYKKRVGFEGIDPSKIIVGIAFYGHAFVVDGGGTNGMGANCDTSIEGNKFTVSYKKIAEEYLTQPNKYTVYTDEQAKARWIYGENLVISYDDPYSIAAKVDYVYENNLGGVMVWQYTQDDSQSTLVNAIYNSINRN